MSPTLVQFVEIVTIWLTPCLALPYVNLDGNNYVRNYPEFFEYPELYERALVDLPVYNPYWPSATVQVGQVSGVGVDTDGGVLVFHRGDRVWNARTFDGANIFANASGRGAIQTNTILRLDPVTGHVTESFGANKFYLPHGLTVDNQGNIWITDVAMHQVMRIPKGKTDPDLVLGEFLVPGNDDEHFCKPTDVAVTSTGEFFVSDGYCNGRILKYDRNGKLLTQWGRKFEGPVNRIDKDGLYIPHSITLLEKQDMICVADREHGRILCYRAGIKDPANTGRFVKMFDHSEFGKVFAISYDSNADVIYAVNGHSFFGNKVQGFIINNKDGKIMGTFEPSGKGFGQPHDIAVSPTGGDIYVGEIYPDRITKFSRG